MSATTLAKHAFKALNGVFCVYKESGVTINKLRSALIVNLIKDLNRMKFDDHGKVIKLIETAGGDFSSPVLDTTAPSTMLPAVASDAAAIVEAAAGTGVEYGLYGREDVRILRQVPIPHATTATAAAASQHERNQPSRVMSVVSVPDLADHPLVRGPLYEEDDIRLLFVDHLSYLASGVMVVGINGTGCWQAKRLRQCRHVSRYRISGVFGTATHNYHTSGRVRYKTTYKHVDRYMIDRICARIQGIHQAAAYDFSRVDMQSEEAYKLACKGLVRPKTGSDPLIYGLRCAEFTSPRIVLEADVINGSSGFLMSIIHEVGTMVRSSATCSGLRRVQCGHFTVNHALLRHQVCLQGVLDNITTCRSLLQMDDLRHKKHLQASADTANQLVATS